MKRLLIVATAALFTGLAVWFFFGSMLDFFGGSKLTVIAAKSPKSAVCVAALTETNSVIRETHDLLSLLADLDDSFKSNFRQVKRELRSVLGSDIFEQGGVQAASDLGLNLNEPVGFTLLELDYDDGPKGVVFNASVRDSEKIEFAINRIAEKKKWVVEEDERDGQLFWEVRESLGCAATILDGKLYVLFGNKSEDYVSDLESHLKECKIRPISEMRQYKKTVPNLPGSGALSVFVNLQSIIDSLPMDETPPLLLDLAGLAIEGNANEISAALLLAENSKIRDFMVTGTSCRDFLAKTERPIGMVCCSLSEPFEFFRYLSENTDKHSSGFEDETLEDAFGLNFDELCDLYSDGATGILTYPPGKDGNPKFMTFIKTNDREVALSVAEKFGPSGERLRKNEFGKNVIWSYEFEYSGSFCRGVVGDYIVLGDAEKQILNLARGECDGWEPICGGKQLASAELFGNDLLEMMSERFSGIAPRNALATAKEFFGDDIHLRAELNFQSGIAIVSVKPDGADFGKGACRILASLAWAPILDGWFEEEWRNEAAEVKAAAGGE